MLISLLVLMPIHSHFSTFFPPILTPRPPFIPAKFMADFELKAVLNFLNEVFMVLFSCTVAFGGAVVGIIIGALKGQTTETGMVRGAGVGAVTGAITALQLVEMMANDEHFSKVALLDSLLNGKVFIEWVSPAVLKAYQWQTNATEMTFSDIFDVDNNGTKGLSEDSINKLPKCTFENPSKAGDQRDEKCKETNCAICLQDYENKEEGRKLPSCTHVFHLKCIDKWLIRQGSCPICRRDV